MGASAKKEGTRPGFTDLTTAVYQGPRQAVSMNASSRTSTGRLMSSMQTRQTGTTGKY